MEPGTDILERSLEDRVKQALELNTHLVDQFELDGISYTLNGYPQVSLDGSCTVFWTHSQAEHSHGGQQGFIGYRDSYDFSDHDDCGLCHPASETSYWNMIERVRDRAKLKFMIRDWTPEDEFWNASI